MTLATWNAEKVFGPLEVGIVEKGFDSNSIKASAISVNI